MKKKSPKIKALKGRLMRAEKHPAKPKSTIVHLANAELEIENAPPLPDEPLIDPIVFDDIADAPKAKTGWAKWWSDIWS